jgi:NAD(P)-dependent dehydrogenase (short-subunit alcohol dehydrogenase family)
MDWSATRVVVTGAASGIGAAVAEQLLDLGATVVAVDLNADGLSPLAVRGAEVCAASVATDEGRATIADAAGDLTHLANVAGLMITEPLETTTPDTWDRVFDVNAKGLFFLCRDLIPRIPSGGAVVNLSSVAAKYSATPEAGIYSASKAAVQCITRMYAHVHGPRGVRVNSVCPGIIDTPMQDLVIARAAAARGIAAEELREARKNNLIPMKREGSAEECARTIVALLGDDMSYVTGQTVNVDGGFQMY